MPINFKSGLAAMDNYRGEQLATACLGYRSSCAKFVAAVRSMPLPVLKSGADLIEGGSLCKAMQLVQSQTEVATTLFRFFNPKGCVKYSPYMSVMMFTVGTAAFFCQLKAGNPHVVAAVRSMLRLLQVRSGPNEGQVIMQCEAAGTTVNRIGNDWYVQFSIS